jgi:hypothetical protein
MSSNILLWIIIAILVFYVIIIIYIKINYKFWSIQPVFHVYNWYYALFPPGIINHHLPDKNKYTNFKDIKTIDYKRLTDLQKQNITHFICLHYLQNDDNIFSPSSKNIFPYFECHNHNSFISIYYEKELKIDLKKSTTEEFSRIIGMISSRPVYISINNGKKNASFFAYYVDYLCVDKARRKQNIASQLIQTHHYNKSHSNKNISVSLFKREDELTGIVPLCAYNTYGFHVTKWTKPISLPPMLTLLAINSTNFYILINFLKTHSYLFDIVINTEPSNIIELIKTKNIFVNVIMEEENIVAAYFFRKTCTYIEKDLEVLSCFASINMLQNIETFAHGFKISFWNIANENKFGFCSIENISHNSHIINNLLLKNKPYIISPTAYFFYNFAYPTFNAEKVLIIN